MKTKLFFLFSIFFFWNVNAQIVNIPDANFKTKLLSADNTKYIAFDYNDQRMKIDINNDGEIDITEANGVRKLSLVGSSISSLEGIKSFQNLEELDCSNNSLATLDLVGLNRLRTLNCNYNLLTSLNVLNLSSLNYISCSFNRFSSLEFPKLDNLTKLECNNNSLLTTLNVQNLSSLESLYCDNNKLTDLNVLSLKNLKNLACGYNNLTNLNVSVLANLEYLSCYYNNISTLNITGLNNLKELYFQYNNISQIDLSLLKNLEILYCFNNKLTDLILDNLQKLRIIYCKNNNLINLNVQGCFNLAELYLEGNNNLKYLNLKTGNNVVFPKIGMLGNNNLAYVCANEYQVSIVKALMDSYNFKAEVNAYCSFKPEGNINSIKGKIILDANRNGCDNNDTSFPFLKMKLLNNANFSLTTIGNQDGDYFFFLSNFGKYTLSPTLEKSDYYAVTPSSATVNFTDTNNNVFTQNFCIIPNGIHNDLDIQILPLSQARPGFETEYRLIYKNKGTTTLSGNVLFAYNDDKLNYISSDIIPNSTETGKLFFNFTDLKPFEEKTIILTLKINLPTDAHFPVNGGDILSYSAQVFPIENDETPRDNTFALRQEVVNSFDPNDKTCLEGDIITPNLVGNDVHYLIRFENVGTANAVNVVVKDMIDTAKFDVESLQPIKSSHPYRMTITEGNKVEFFFENIQLPYDDANNDGYILFKIKTKPTLFVGDTFSNKADIYFDYNFPIATNEAITTVQNVLGTQEFSKSEISIFPNPTKDVLNFKTSEKIRKAEIYDTNGRLIKVELGISNNQMNVSALKTGTYVIKVISDKKYHQTKFIKQ